MAQKTPFEERASPITGMIQQALNAEYKTRINIRPIKRAYFVREDDIDGLLKVLRYVCTEWGGIRNLIIPVDRDFSIPPLFLAQLAYHEPDQFIDFANNSQEVDHQQHWKNLQVLRDLFRWRNITVSLHDSFIKFDAAMHPLSVIPEPRDSKQPLFTHVFEGPKEDEWLLLAAFGSIYEGQTEAYEKDLLLYHNNIGIDTPSFWGQQSNDAPFGSVLNLTAFGIRPTLVEDGGESNHFDVVFVNSIQSLCMFWNFRAVREAEEFHTGYGRRTILLPERLLEGNGMGSLAEFVQTHLSHPGASSNLHLRFCVWDDDSQRQLESAVRKMKSFELFTEDTIVLTFKWGRQTSLEAKPASVKYGIGLPTTATSYREGCGSSMAVNISLKDGKNEIYFSPPAGFHNRFSQSAVIDIESDIWQRYPKDARVADRIRDTAWFTRYGLTFITNPPTTPAYLSVSLVSEWEAVELYFSARGYETRPSKNGAYAEAVVNLPKGIKNIDLLSQEHAYRLLDTLALKSSKKVSQRIVSSLGLNQGTLTEIQRIISDVQIVPELKRIPKSYRQLLGLFPKDEQEGLLQLLSQLSAKQVIKRGFNLPCQNCGMLAWYPLQVIQETVTCTGCSAEFALPVEAPAGSEIQWEYTLNSLVNRAMDQDALPSAFALRYLTEKAQTSCLTLGLELLQSNQVKAELDFLLVSEQDVMSGECKAGPHLEDKDIETGRLAATLGIKNFYYCTMATFDEASLQRIEKLRQELKSDGWPTTLGVLQRSDLLR